MSALAEIPAALLVGGLGSRLRGLVADRPKPLAEINGRPFVTYLLDQLHDAGVRTATLCTGHLGHLVAATLGDSYRGLSLNYSQEPEPCGTGGALRLAASRLVGDSVLVLNGDSYCQVDFAAFVDCYRRQCAEIALVLAHVEQTAAFGRVELDPAGHVVHFAEKGAATGPGLINAGIYLLARRRLLAIPADRPVSLEREIFPSSLGPAMIGWTSQGRFLDIGTPESFRAAGEFLARLAPSG